MPHHIEDANDHLYSELQQSEGVYETPVCRIESEEHLYTELPPPDDVYDTPRVAGNTRTESVLNAEPQYFELQQPESNYSYEAVGVAEEVPLHFHMDWMGFGTYE